jgi:hypothetical protein
MLQMLTAPASITHYFLSVMTNYENLEALEEAIEQLRQKRQGDFHCPNTKCGLCSYKLGCNDDHTPCRDCPHFKEETNAS